VQEKCLSKKCLKRFDKDAECGILAAVLEVVKLEER
jgi:hypothetical protein